ncbi:MAG: RNase H family protein [Gemmatimonadota bacterium]
MNPVVIHVDESCLGNQFQDRSTPGGAGGLLEVRSDGEIARRDLWISEPDTTNNRMALKSALETLGSLSRPRTVELVSDSQYLVKGMNEWIHGWKRRGWQRKGGAIENLELWQRLDRVAQAHTIRWVWVRGHAGHPKNEYANHLATRAAQVQDQSGGLVDSGFLEWLAGERARGRYLDYDPDVF